MCLKCVRKTNKIIPAATIKVYDDGQEISEFDVRSGGRKKPQIQTLEQYNNGVSTPSGGIFSGDKSRNSVVVKGPKRILSRKTSLNVDERNTLGGPTKFDPYRT